MPGFSLQFGRNNRYARRDFIENHWHDIGAWEATATAAQRDHRAIDDERYFKRRFGFDAPLEQRRDTVEVKKRLDLTDLEISKLKKSGLLTLRKGKPTSLCADRCVWLMGWVFLLGMLATLGASMLSIALANLPPLRQFAGMATGALMLFGALWGIASISFEPLQIIRARGIGLGQTWRLDSSR